MYFLAERHQDRPQLAAGVQGGPVPHGRATRGLSRDGLHRVHVQGHQRGRIRQRVRARVCRLRYTGLYTGRNKLR